MKCVKGVCEPYETNVRMHCFWTSMCPTNMFCASNYCVKKNSIGQQCSVNDQCGFGTFCYQDPTTRIKTCTRSFSLVDGTEVTEDIAGRLPCHSGFIKTIGKKMYCMKPDKLITSSTTAFEKGSLCYYNSYDDPTNPDVATVKSMEVACGYNKDGMAYCN